jgi:hypothetical protein
MAELGNASVPHPRDGGSNLDMGKVISDSVCIGLEFKFLGR